VARRCWTQGDIKTGRVADTRARLTPKEEPAATTARIAPTDHNESTIIRPTRHRLSVFSGSTAPLFPLSGALVVVVPDDVGVKNSSHLGYCSDSCRLGYRPATKREEKDGIMYPWTTVAGRPSVFESLALRAMGERALGSCRRL